MIFGLFRGYHHFRKQPCTTAIELNAAASLAEVIFLQTDIMSGGHWIDKASLICKEADTLGRTNLHHKFWFHYGFGVFFFPVII